MQLPIQTPCSTLTFLMLLNAITRQKEQIRVSLAASDEDRASRKALLDTLAIFLTLRRLLVTSIVVLGHPEAVRVTVRRCSIDSKEAHQRLMLWVFSVM